MKKFIYSFAVIAALGLVACGGNKNTEATEEVVEEPVVEAVEETVAEEDSCCAGDSCCAEAAAEVVEVAGE